MNIKSRLAARLVKATGIPIDDPTNAIVHEALMKGSTQFLIREVAAHTKDQVLDAANYARAAASLIIKDNTPDLSEARSRLSKFHSRIKDAAYK